MALLAAQAADYAYKKLIGIGFTSASVETYNEKTPDGLKTLVSPLTIPSTNVRVDAGLIPTIVLTSLQPSQGSSFTAPSSPNIYLARNGQTYVSATNVNASPAKYQETTLTAYAGNIARQVWYSEDLKGGIPSTFTSGSDYNIQLVIERSGGGTDYVPQSYGYFIDTDSGVVVFTNPNAPTNITAADTLKARFFKYTGRMMSDVLTPSSANLTGSFSGSFKGTFVDDNGNPISGGSGGVQSIISSSEGAYVSASGANVIVSASLFQVSASTIQLTGSLTAGDAVVFSNQNNQFTGSFSGSFSGISTDTISSGTFKVQVLSTGLIQATGSLDVSGSNHKITGSVSVAGAVTASQAISTPTVGNLTSISASAGTINISGSLVPDADNAHDLGSTSKKWKSVVATSVTASTATFANGNITFASNGDAVFANTTTASFQGKVIIQDSTTIATSTKYVLINSGSTTTQYGGLLNVSAVSSSYGVVFRPNGQNGRWALTSGSNWNNATDVANSVFQPIVTVTGSTGAPAAVTPRFADGGTLGSAGEIYVDTTTGDIYIYTTTP